MAKILVVDDDADLLEALKEVLEGKGYAVVTALNGEEGYQKAREEHPDLMLLDVMMTTEHEGFEVAKRLHEDPATQHLPVILLTGIRKAKQLPFAYEPDEEWLPVRAVVEKPVHPDVLLKKIESVLKA